MAVITRDEPRAGNVVERAGAAVRLAGAVVSIGLMIGVSVWGYRLFVRDMTGVPVVRAMSGPMREAPADPGGQVALHTGLAVNAVAALGGAAPSEDVLFLAPATAGLAPEDLEVQSMAVADEVTVTEPLMQTERLAETDILAASLGSGRAGLPNPETSDAGISPLPATVPDTPMTAAEVLALADMIAAGVEPLTPLAPLPVSADGIAPETAAVSRAPHTDLSDPSAQELSFAATATRLQTAQIPQDVPGVRVAWRPPARPGSGEGQAAGTESAPEPVNLIGPSVAAGTPLVQLGAYETAEIAAADWIALSERFADFMGGKGRVIQAAESGGEVFVRLRAAGFADIAEANRFCAALIAEGARCVPVIEE